MISTDSNLYVILYKTKKFRRVYAYDSCALVFSLFGTGQFRLYTCSPFTDMV